MKTKNVITILCCIILICNNYSQSLILSQGGIFDRVYDRFGNGYQLEDLRLTSTKPIGGATSVNSLPVYTCSAGYFDLYYAAGSCFDGSSQAASDRRAVLCQLFTDISNFINSPLSQVTNTVRINMYCSDTPSNSPLTLGTAGAFYVVPGNPSNPYPGIAQNQIQKAIISGQDPYASLPISFFAGANNFYHGLLNANPSPVSSTWNYNLNTSSISSSELDFYTIMLHEVVHALGFGSLIDANGFSKFGQNNNYYSTYDRFLKDQSGISLLSAANSACQTSSLSFQGSTLALAPGCNTNVPTATTTCSSAIQYSSTNVNNVSVSTPACWVGGTSLSHFEDYCSTPSSYANSCSVSANPANSFNDLYYVMSDKAGSGNCYLKRYLKPEERYVLCDLGYAVKSSYSSSTTAPVAMIDGTASTHSYSGGACSGLNIWGQNDGLVNSVFTFTANSSITNVIGIPITASITANDATTTIGMSCIEVVYNNATTSISSGSLIVTTTIGYEGFVLIKYLPVNSAGDFGNPTYIYSYFLPGTCNPPNACDLVQNGGFEQTNSSGPSYGTMGSAPGTAAISCWSHFLSTPDVFRRFSPAPFNLGVNTNNISPPVDSYNGSPNNTIIGLGGGPAGGETLKNNLSAPLTNGTTYQCSMWVLNHPAATILPGITPLVISVGSLPDFASIATPTPIIEFTVSTMGSGTNWTLLSGTFIYTPTANSSAITINLNGPKTMALGFLNLSQLIYYFVDDISIIPVPSPTFAIPNANVCGNISFTNLAQYASPIAGVFSGQGITTTNSGGTTLYHFNTGLTLPAGNYPISFTYTTSSGCVNTLKQNVTIAPIPTISATSSNYICSNLSNNTSTLSVTCTSCVGVTNYAWLPTYQIGNSVTVSPSSTTIFTVSPIGGFCTTTQTLAVIVQSLCCTQTVSAYASSSITTTSNFTTPRVFNTDISVTPSGWLTLTGSEFLFASNVKLTVKSGAVLTLQGSHLYGCTGDMWKGIYVEDGGKVRVLTSSLTYDNLIEDAIIGIDAERIITSGNTEIELHRTTFNKNYTDIGVYGAVNTFIVDNCVFTCRDLPFTSTAWPQTGTSSTLTTTGGQLRTVINPTTGLIGPYLSGFPLANLKNPYSANYSHTAIKIANLFIASTGTITNIGKNTSPSDFNLFDSHTLGIFAVNSSLNSINNVFQNSIEGNTGSPFVNGGFAKVPGAAITHYIANLMNAKLDISASNVNIGNRFWNCHRSVVADNLFSFVAENVLCRSSQSNTNVGVFTQGNSGFFTSTNRFDEYYIRDCEFTNINTAINIPITSGQFTATGVGNGYGTIANRIRIIYNTFSAGTLSNGYMSNAVLVTGFNNLPYFSPSVTVTPFTQAVVVQGNTITDSYRGISVNGITGFQTQIEDNTISLREDNAFYSLQHGIRMENCNPTSGLSLGKNIIANNTLDFGTLTSYTNTLGSLIYCSNNGYGMASPSITCNNLSKSHQGFVFDGPNSGALWAGNSIYLPMTRGFVLDFGGYINTQGGSNMVINNAWLGGTWSGNYKGTYVNAGSSATASVLWVDNSSTTYPPNPAGAVSVNLQDRYDPTSGNLQTSNVASYNCEGIPNARVISIPYADDFATSEQFYIAKTALYRFLSYNDSLVASDSECADFYDSQEGTSIDKFRQTEANLMLGDLATGATINADVEPINSIETNYKNYYSLYLSLAADNFNYTIDDSIALVNLCSLCPGTNGAVIYQARALYNFIFKQPYMYFPCSNGEGARLLNISDNKDDNSASMTWDFEIFPNPATNQISIINKFRSDLLKIELKDLTGRVTDFRNLNSTEFITNLELGLINGVYFVTVTNSKGDKLTKKLVIAK